MTRDWRGRRIEKKNLFSDSFKAMDAHAGRDPNRRGHEEWGESGVGWSGVERRGGEGTGSIRFDGFTHTHTLSLYLFPLPFNLFDLSSVPTLPQCVSLLVLSSFSFARDRTRTRELLTPLPLLFFSPPLPSKQCAKGREEGERERERKGEAATVVAAAVRGRGKTKQNKKKRNRDLSLVYLRFPATPHHRSSSACRSGVSSIVRERGSIGARTHQPQQQQQQEEVEEETAENESNRAEEREREEKERKNEQQQQREQQQTNRSTDEP